MKASQYTVQALSSVLTLLSPHHPLGLMLTTSPKDKRSETS